MQIHTAELQMRSFSQSRLLRKIIDRYAEMDIALVMKSISNIAL